MNMTRLCQDKEIPCEGREGRGLGQDPRIQLHQVFPSTPKKATMKGHQHIYAAFFITTVEVIGFDEIEHAGERILPRLIPSGLSVTSRVLSQTAKTQCLQEGPGVFGLKFSVSFGSSTASSSCCLCLRLLLLCHPEECQGEAPHFALAFQEWVPSVTSPILSQRNTPSPLYSPISEYVLQDRVWVLFPVSLLLLVPKTSENFPELNFSSAWCSIPCQYMLACQKVLPFFKIKSISYCIFAMADSC